VSGVAGMGGWRPMGLDDVVRLMLSHILFIRHTYV